MKITIQARPLFHISLTIDHVKALIKMATNHYDFTCRNYARSGGLLYGWLNRLSPVGEAPPMEYVDGSFRDLDMCKKIMENAHGLTPEESALVSEMYAAFGKALDMANNELGKVKIKAVGFDSECANG